MGSVALSESLPIETDSLRLDSWVVNSGDKIGFCAVKESQNLSACQTFQTQNREKSSSLKLCDKARWQHSPKTQEIHTGVVFS